MIKDLIGPGHPACDVTRQLNNAATAAPAGERSERGALDGPSRAGGRLHDRSNATPPITER